MYSVRPVVVATFALAISINAAACADPDGPLRATLDDAVRDGINEAEDAVEKYPRILYHTTAWTMTWVFVDDKGVVRGYWLTAQ